MTPARFILAALGSLPNRKIEGKKRLQKLGMLLQYAGLDLDADYMLHHYGPYSFDLAEAANELIWSSEINENNEPIGVYGMYQSVFSLSEEVDQSDELPAPFKEKLLELEKFSTIELEMASTIALFLRDGLGHDAAIEEASILKKAKAIPPVLEKSEKILAILS